MSSRNPGTPEKILNAALKLLGASRGQGVRMSDIAKQAGISRQALYLHFETRAELLIAATFYFDEQKDVAGRLAPSRTARSGTERLDAYIEAWGNYIPEMYGIAKVLLALGENDEAAAAAWRQRMQDMREGCEAAMLALNRDGALSPDHSPEEATDILWTMLSVHNWQQLTIDCGWSQEKYVATLQALARRLFVRES